jgi:hypothetical protein
LSSFNQESALSHLNYLRKKPLDEAKCHRKVRPVMKQLLPLAESEALFAPFQDPFLSRQMDFTLVPASGVGFRSEISWDSVYVKWDSCPIGEVAGGLEMPLELPCGEYDELVFCLTFPVGLSVRFMSKPANGEWKTLGDAVEGSMSRQEIVRSVPKEGAVALRVEFIAREACSQDVKLIWFALRNSRLAADVQRNKVRWNAEWSGLIKPEAEWGALVFRRGLLLKNDQLAALRAKKNLPFWRDHFARLEAAARKAMARNPEEELFLSDYAPFSDERYVRETERGRTGFYYDALRLAVVGLVNEDRAMIRHALRYLMSMLHLKSWTCSAEMRVTGSTFDQRCFIEEMMSTSVSLLMDMLDGALTDRARELGQTMLQQRLSHQH